MKSIDINNLKRYTVSSQCEIDLGFKYKQYSESCWKYHNGEIVQCGGYKPNGLWYAFGDEWIKFRRIINLSYLFQIDLAEEIKLLRLSSKEDIIKFNIAYAADTNNRAINWKQVASEYDGIEIIPFIKNLSSFYWYNTFDIASGCIWNLAVIKNVCSVN